MRQRKLDAEASALAVRLQVTEAAARNIIKRCTEAGVDYTTFQPGQKLPKKPAAPLGDIEETKPVATLPADAWDDPPTPAVPKVAPKPPSAPRPIRKEQIEYQIADEVVEIDGEMINATLTRKQKMAMLARAIKATGDNALDPIELVRAINAHTDLAGDTVEGSVFELHLFLDPVAPTPAQMADAFVPSVSKEKR